MEPNQPSPRERRRAADDAAIRRRKTDVALGGAGVALVFASSIGSILISNLPLAPFIVLEIAGLALIVFSFFRLRAAPLPASRRRPEK